MCALKNSPQNQPKMRIFDLKSPKSGRLRVGRRKKKVFSDSTQNLGFYMRKVDPHAPYSLSYPVFSLFFGNFGGFRRFSDHVHNVHTAFSTDLDGERANFVFYIFRGQCEVLIF